MYILNQFVISLTIQEYVLSKGLLSTPIISSAINKPIKNTIIEADFLDSNLSQVNKRKQLLCTMTTFQVTHLSPEKQIKLKNEKEELKSHRRSSPPDYVSAENTSTLIGKGYKNQISSPTFTNISTIQCRLLPRDVSRMFASSEGILWNTEEQNLKKIISDLDGSTLSTLSVSTAHQSFQISKQSLVSISAPPSNEVLTTNIWPANEDISKGQTKSLKVNSNYEERQFNSKIEEVHEKDEVYTFDFFRFQALHVMFR